MRALVRFVTALFCSAAALACTGPAPGPVDERLLAHDCDRDGPLMLEPVLVDDFNSFRCWTEGSANSSVTDLSNSTAVLKTQDEFDTYFSNCRFDILDQILPVDFSSEFVVTGRVGGTSTTSDVRRNEIELCEATLTYHVVVECGDGALVTHPLYYVVLDRKYVDKAVVFDVNINLCR